MKSRTFNTLFMLSSVDGKISTGDNDRLDVDIDFPKIVGVKEGLRQYYDLEKQTDFVSFNSGKVQEKIGVNNRIWQNKVSDNVSFAVVDNKPHLNMQGTKYFAKRSKIFYLITTNPKHPAFQLERTLKNIRVLFYEKGIDFADVFTRLKSEYNIEKITIQTGGTLNARLLRLGLIDRIHIVVAPCLIGGKDTQSLIGGESLHSQNDLMQIKALKLVSVESLENSYIHIYYDVINATEIEE